MSDHGLVAARCLKRQLDRAGHILGPHVRAELPGEDVAAVVVEDGGKVIRARANDLEVVKVSLPHLVDGGGLVRELIGGLDHHLARRSNQINGFQDAINL